MQQKIQTNTKYFYRCINRKVFELENIHNETKILLEVLDTNNEKGDLNEVTKKTELIYMCVFKHSMSDK